MSDPFLDFINELSAQKASEPRTQQIKNKLVQKLEEIGAPYIMIQDAMNGEYGDFTNIKYSCPKMILMQQLSDIGTPEAQKLLQDVMDGEYDD